jgi:hypothetical protein
MTKFDWIMLVMSTISILLIPSLLLLVRLVTKWTRAEERLMELAKDMGELVKDKDKVHAEMLAQMREDRSVTDRRLRWLEENLWASSIVRKEGRRAVQSGEEG